MGRARAAKSARNRELLKRDPHAEIVISQNLWNDAGARWRKLQTELLTFAGIVVVTARGKEVTEVDANGRLIEGRRPGRCRPTESSPKPGSTVDLGVLPR
jgi:hypothetical protein